jgi:hypothetical protein
MLRKLLRETLKLSKHIRKDYLKLQQQRDQQPLQQQQPEQQQRELVELSSSSRHLIVEQQPQDEETCAALGYLLLDNDPPIKVTVDAKTKFIEATERAHESYTMPKHIDSNKQFAFPKPRGTISSTSIFY